jgi:hypothetical protein
VNLALAAHAPHRLVDGTVHRRLLVGLKPGGRQLGVDEHPLNLG